jgi:shikimate dehydrogenase
MAHPSDIARIAGFASNPIDAAAIGGRAFAAVIGDAPSQYSKSPQLWNAAFAATGIDAFYFPLDVDEAHLGGLVRTLKESDRFLGANVTVSHKTRVIDFLDDVDPAARQIQAVNTIVRAADGRLIGYNTDGEGFIESLLRPQPDQSGSLLATLSGRSVLLLGAGGSARALAFHLAIKLQGANLVICNRTLEHGEALAREIKVAGGNALAISENEARRCAPAVGLIVNSTTKGQGGLRGSGAGAQWLLEPYSALAPAHPPLLPRDGLAPAEFEKRWRAAAQADIDSNNRVSLSIAQSVPAETAFYDLIYHPEETVFLRHARITGHRTMNGKAMIVNQAALAFCNHVCRAALDHRGRDRSHILDRLIDIMYSAW